MVKDFSGLFKKLLLLIYIYIQVSNFLSLSTLTGVNPSLSCAQFTPALKIIIRIVARFDNSILMYCHKARLDFYEIYENFVLMF
jgi:hypothetical protein